MLFYLHGDAMHNWLEHTHNEWHNILTQALAMMDAITFVILVIVLTLKQTHIFLAAAEAFVIDVVFME